MASPNHQEHRSGGINHIVNAALNRIAHIARPDGRLEDYIGMKTGSERQKALKEARIASGMKGSNVWLPVKVLDQLKEKFPGPRGGIDWLAVVKSALDSHKARADRFVQEDEMGDSWRVEALSRIGIDFEDEWLKAKTDEDRRKMLKAGRDRVPYARNILLIVEAFETGQKRPEKPPEFT